MIVRFALDPDALLLDGYDPALQDKFTTDLFRLWQHCGVLCLGASSYHKSALHQRVEALRPALRDRWIKQIMWAQERGLLRTGPPSWPGKLSGSESLPFDGAAPMVKVGAITREFAAAIGFAAGQPARGGEPELSRLECLESAPAFQRAIQEREGKRCRFGQTVESVWDRLFGPLVAQFDLFVIVDRFCIRRMYTSTALPSPSSCWADQKPGGSGIEKFLARVDATTGCDRRKNVQVFSTLGPRQNPQDVIETLRDFVANLPNAKIGSLELCIVSDHHFKRIVHHRYVRFNAHHCLVLDQGIEILEGTILSRTHLYGFHDFADGILRADEASLLGDHNEYTQYSVFKR